MKVFLHPVAPHDQRLLGIPLLMGTESGNPCELPSEFRELRLLLFYRYLHITAVRNGQYLIFKSIVLTDQQSKISTLE